MISDEFGHIGVDLSNSQANLITIGISLLLMPIVLVRQFNRIKV